MVDHLKRTAEGLGLPFGDRKMTCNSRLAQELGLWAESRGKGEPFHMAAFNAYFVDGINLAKVPLLLELVKNIDLPVDEAEEVLTSRSFKENVDRDWADSRFKNVTAVPTFIMNHYKLVGAQSYASFVDMVTENGVKKRQ